MKKGVWKIVLSVMFLIAGFGSISQNAGNAVVMLVIGLGLGFWWYLPYLKAKNAAREAELAAAKAQEAERIAMAAEAEARRAADPLAPAEIDGHELAYHYPDVRLRVPYELTGEKDARINNVIALGVKRGDDLDISFDPYNISGEIDPDNVVISWHGVKLGDMQKTHLCGMVKRWSDAGLPIYCAMFWPSDSRDFLVEFGFYGKPGNGVKG